MKEEREKKENKMHAEKERLIEKGKRCFKREISEGMTNFSTERRRRSARSGAGVDDDDRRTRTRRGLR